MIKITLTWPEFKQEITERGLSLDYIETVDFYYIFTSSAGVELDCRLLKNDFENLADFEQNYKD